MSMLPRRSRVREDVVARQLVEDLRQVFRIDDAQIPRISGCAARVSAKLYARDVRVGTAHGDRNVRGDGPRDESRLLARHERAQ